MKTEAAVLFGTNDLRIEELLIPKLLPGQVLVQMAYSGVCRSQLLELEGQRGEDRFLPHTLGHEGTGTVLEVGGGVKKIKPGDHVVLTWIKGEGADVPSTAYQVGKTKVNSGAISTFMGQTVTCENRLIPLPKEMPLKEATLFGCMIPTGAGIVYNTAKMQAGSSLVVFGVGGIGLSVVLAAALSGVSPIVAVDIHDSKLKLAESIGATHAVNGKTCPDVLGEIHQILGQGGADFAVEAAGQSVTMETAFRSVRTAGGRCILAGNLAHGGKISIDPFDLIRGKQIIGTWGGETQPDRDIPRYTDLFLQGKMNLNPLITHEYRLDGIQQAFEDLKQARLGRALITFGDRSEDLSPGA